MRERKIAVVTGGERGIGRSCLERLVADDWFVVAAGVDKGAAAKFFSDLRSDQARFVPCDVSVEKEVELLIQAIRADYGRLDAMVLNAGLASPRRVPIEELSLEDWNRVISVNLTGAFLCARAAAPMLRASEGSIVLIASTRATMSEPNTFAYSASKGGLVALGHSLAISLGPQVRVNSISPGWIHNGLDSELSLEDHSQHPVGRVGRPEDIADMTAFLIGPKAGFVTGQDFVVDGGMTRKMIYLA